MIFWQDKTCGRWKKNGKLSPDNGEGSRMNIMMMVMIAVADEGTTKMTVAMGDVDDGRENMGTTTMTMMINMVDGGGG